MSFERRFRALGGAPLAASLILSNSFLIERRLSRNACLGRQAACLLSALARQNRHSMSGEVGRKTE